MSYASKEQLKQILQKIDDNFARKDGYYANMAVGDAEQLIASVGITDNEPYNFRTSGGSADIGNRMDDKIVGGTICWNQLVSNGNFSSTSGWDFVGASETASGNVLTVKATSSAPGGNKYLRLPFTLTVSNKYLVLLKAMNGKGSIVLDGIGAYRSYSVESDKFTQVADIRAATSAELILYPYSSGSNVSLDDEVKLKEFMIFDLTKMFGSAIADHIYSLERATKGAGVEWFKNLFPKPYYKRNAGELMSVNTSAHKMIGFNAFDESVGKVATGFWWNNGQIETATATSRAASIIGDSSEGYKIEVLPNTTYTVELPDKPSVAISLYLTEFASDGAFSHTQSSIYMNGTSVRFTTSSNTRWIGIGFYSGSGALTPEMFNRVCLHITHSGYRDGEYETHKEYTYALDNIELRGMPILENGKLRYDGDTYSSDGTVTRKYYAYTFTGIESVNYHASTGENDTSRFDVTPNQLPYIKSDASYTTIKNILFAGYIKTAQISNINNPPTTTGYISSINGAVTITDTRFTSANSFKEYLAGKTIIYEMVNPMVEQNSPYTNPQVVDDFGTEEYIDALATAETNPRDVAIPVGHETFYQANLRDKLQNLPENASADGLYLVKQTGNKQELIAYTPESELPVSPAETGTYVLKLVDGTLTWVLES